MGCQEWAGCGMGKRGGVWRAVEWAGCGMGRVVEWAGGGGSASHMQGGREGGRAGQGASRIVEFSSGEAEGKVE